MEQMFHPYETKFVLPWILVQIIRGFFSDHIAQRLLNHSPLLEEVMYGLMFEVVHRALAEEWQPSLDAAHTCTHSQVTEQYQVERDRSSEDRVTAKEVYLDFHRVTHPAEDVDIVPCFFIVLAGRIVIDAYLMIYVSIQVREFFGFEDVVNDR